MITVYCVDAVPDIDAIAERDHRLLLDLGVYVARGIARFKQRRSQLLVTNFSEEYQHLNRGAAIAFLEETQQQSDVIAGFERSPEDTFKLPNPFDVNTALPQEELKTLLGLLRRYS